MPLTDENGSPLYTNRLIEENSPYLRQHAHNPVDWFPWGEEAFAEAHRQDKPVFLSIGYSTCHWCHVMEHESFDNLEIADYLNDHFVSIKLDREQRPDLDDIYMTGTQLMTGHGGWPMSNFLTSEGKPFYAGTYFPPANFLHLLNQLIALWQTKRNEVEGQATQIVSAITRYTNAKSANTELGDMLTPATGELLGRLDRVHGGFGSAPKFPNESQLLLLLEDCRRQKQMPSRAALQLTLDHLYQGGIYDQIAGGFHRYAVDQEWLVPHFEKMLYNQSQLLTLFAQAKNLLAEPSYGRIAEEIGAYVLRDMCSPDGVFYSATDADSEGEEGLFFVWTPEELQDALTAEDCALVTEIYGVTETGNFEGKNILHLKGPVSEYAGAHNLDPAALYDQLTVIKTALYNYREQRIHPLRDEKVITAWNGMMISAFAVAGHHLAVPGFLTAAVRAGEYIWQHHWRPERLWRISLDGHTSIDGNLEDYACFAEASLELYRYTADALWLERGGAILERMNALFWDAENGGYFFSHATDLGPLITRPKSPMDGATPSGNAVAMNALVQHWYMTGDVETEKKILQTANGFSGLLTKTPSAFSYMVVALHQYNHGQSGLIQYAAEGRIRVALQTNDGRATLNIRIQPGWHINGHKTTQDLIPTNVTGEGITDTEYPQGTAHKLAFMNEETTLYKDEITITLTTTPGPLTLQLQACDETRCLAPETLTFTV